eukprot:TRINITY_DN28518_c0_g1_i1.p2 TRINITY_DN28518_c0_g1~~TRINITY_DN28518_c0_g1_i1.p2  ORF type:complete len:340 (+),score=120.67 TRINITY_DN28518_c0_g1_i1:65-1021(+)
MAADTADAGAVRALLRELRLPPAAAEYTEVWVGVVEPKRASKVLGELNKRKPQRAAGLEYLKSIVKNRETQALEVFYGRTPEGAEEFGLGPMRQVTVAGVFPADPDEWKAKNELWPFTKPAPPPIATLPKNMPDADLLGIHDNYAKLVDAAAAAKSSQCAIVVGADGTVLAEHAGGWEGAYTPLGETHGATARGKAEDRPTGSQDPLAHCITGLIERFSAANAASFHPNEFRKRTKDEQYLLTNLCVYTVHEPCVMCAMALLHSRCGRLFYLHGNPRFGGAGGLHHVHAEPNLNHHFPAYHYPHPALTDRLRAALVDE